MQEHLKQYGFMKPLKHNEHLTLRNVGEFKLIERIHSIVPRLKDASVVCGIGDDAAVIRINENRLLLVTCDIQIQGQHFDINDSSYYQIGKKAAAVNLSDIAAMGGIPRFALVSLGLPQELELNHFDDLNKGLGDTLKDFGAFIIGGNLSRSPGGIIIDITLLGETEGGSFVARDGARQGDSIYVSGRLGASAAGHHILQKHDNALNKKFVEAITAFCEPEPRVRLGRMLAQSGWVTSMIDLSDGLLADLSHICTASGVGAAIWKNKIPVFLKKTLFEKVASVSPLELALNGGEDYELLFTIKPDTPAQVLQKISKELKTPLTQIGEILPYELGVKVIDEHGQPLEIEARGWDHFRNT
jgi:thiamine-monophosphate kinase